VMPKIQIRSQDSRHQVTLGNLNCHCSLLKTLLASLEGPALQGIGDCHELYFWSS